MRLAPFFMGRKRMLRIHQLASAKGAKRYYCAALSRGDYYIKDCGGTWHGKLVKGLKLPNNVDRLAFGRLIDNLHPRTKQKITQRMRKDRRPAYDFTFSCPKSVSLALYLGGDRRIKSVFEKAVHESMRDMENEVRTRVRAKGANYDRRTGNFIYAAFTHDTSREVDMADFGGKGILPMPHLHTHCIVMNFTFDKEEHKVKALTVKDIKEQAPTWQKLFNEKLAKGLEALGYETENTKHGFEIVGIPRGVCWRFSLRSEEIERMAKVLNIKNPEVKAKLGVTTRRKKTLAITEDELLRRWLLMLSEKERENMKRLKLTKKTVKPDRVKFVGTVLPIQQIAHETPAQREEPPPKATKIELGEFSMLSQFLQSSLQDLTPSKSVQNFCHKTRLLRSR